MKHRHRMHRQTALKSDEVQKGPLEVLPQVGETWRFVVAKGFTLTCKIVEICTGGGAFHVAHPLHAVSFHVLKDSLLERVFQFSVEKDYEGTSFNKYNV